MWLKGRSIEIYRVVVVIGCIRNTQQSYTQKFGILYVTVSRQGRALYIAAPKLAIEPFIKPFVEPFIELFIELLQSYYRTSRRVVYRAILEPLWGRYRAVPGPFVEIIQSCLYRRLYKVTIQEIVEPLQSCLQRWL